MKGGRWWRENVGNLNRCSCHTTADRIGWLQRQRRVGLLATTWNTAANQTHTANVHHGRNEKGERNYARYRNAYGEPSSVQYTQRVCGKLPAQERGAWRFARPHDAQVGRMGGGGNSGNARRSVREGVVNWKIMREPNGGRAECSGEKSKSASGGEGQTMVRRGQPSRDQMSRMKSVECQNGGASAGRYIQHAKNG